MTRILVTSAGGRLGMNFSRALRAAGKSMLGRHPDQSGYPVRRDDGYYLIGVDSSEYRLHRADADERHLIPASNDPDYIPVLQDIVQETHPDLICVELDGELLPISAAREQLGAPVWLPRHETLKLCNDKMASYRRWARTGVPVPLSFAINSEPDLARAFDELNGRVWLREFKGTGGKGALPTDDFETARQWIEMRRGWGNFMASQWLEKQTITWESIWMDGELVIAQSRRRFYWEMANLTMSGVTGVCGAGDFPADPEIDELSLRAIRAIDPRPDGVLGVDFTYDRDGKPYVTEVNAGRFMSGGVIQAYEFGPNFAQIFVEAALARTGKPALMKKPGFRTPVLNPLPQDLVLVAGVDTEAVFMRSREVAEAREALEARRQKARRGVLLAA